MNEIELQFIKKLFDDNTLFYKTKVKLNHLTDILALTLFNEFGKCMITFGGFVPFEHLKPLCNDEDRMEKYKKLNYPLEIKEPINIINFINNYVSDTNFITLEKTILDAYNRRKLMDIASETMDKLDDSKNTIKDILRNISYKIDSIKHDTSDNISFLSGKDVVEAERRRLSSDETVHYYETGFDFIDDYTNGLTAPATVFVVSPPKTGKSMSLYELTVNQLRKNKSVLFSTIEINESECYRKILSNMAQVDYHKIVKKSFSEAEKQRYLKALDELEKYKDKLFIIYDKTGISPSDIKHYYQNLEKVGIKCDFICIDYLGLLNSDEGDTAEVDKMTKLPRQIRILSQETNSIIFCPQQMKLSATKTNINDLTANDVYYSKPLAMEGTLGYFMIKDKDTGSLIIKNFFSRIGEMDDVWHFPNRDFNKCSLGKAEIYEKIEF